VENKCKDIGQLEEEATYSLSAGIVAALTTFERAVVMGRKRRVQ
jgi:hypothetical protein